MLFEWKNFDGDRFGIDFDTELECGVCLEIYFDRELECEVCLRIHFDRELECFFFV